MITGEPMTEYQYRQLDAVSQTMLREFYDDRKKFYKKYILGEVVEEEMSQAMKIGHIVHCLSFRPEEFDTKFFMSICTEPPTGLMLKFVQALARATRNAVDEEGIVRKEFGELAQEAYVTSGFKWNLTRVLENFRHGQPENFYNELRAAMINNQIVITTDDVDNGRRIFDTLHTGEFLQDIFRNTNPSVEYLDEMPITGFAVEGRPHKALPDRLEINHEERYIQPWDLKIVWAVENFYKEYYLKRKGYLQVANYDLGCTHLRNQEYPGYEVRPMKFVVCDSVDYYTPLIYKLQRSDIIDSLKGFKHRGVWYKGLIELTRELNWHIENDIWNMSMENYLNKGEVVVSSLKEE